MEGGKKQSVYMELRQEDAMPIEDEVPAVRKESVFADEYCGGINIQKGLARFGNDDESYIQVLRSFNDNTKPLLAQMRGVAEEKLNDYAIIVHGIKGSVRGMCAETVGNKAEALEHASKAGDWKLVKANNDDLIKLAEKLISDIDALLGRIRAKANITKKDKPDTEELKKLMKACADYDMDAVDEAMTEVDGYEYENDIDLVAWLRANVVQTNFSEIVERLTEYLGYSPVTCGHSIAGEG